MSAEQEPMTPLEMLAYMVEQNAPAYAIANQRRLCGLPDEPAPAIVIRTASAPARRPRTRRKTTKQSATAATSKPTPATSKSRVQTRFDLKD